MTRRSLQGTKPSPAAEICWASPGFHHHLKMSWWPFLSLGVGGKQQHAPKHGSSWIHTHILNIYEYIIVLHCLPILRRQFTTYGAATDGLYCCLLFMSYSQWSHKSSFCLTQYFLHSNATGTHNHTPVGLSSCYQIITWQGPTSATDLKKVQSKQTPSKEYLRTLGPVCWMKVCWLHVMAGMACGESTSCLHIVSYCHVHAQVGHLMQICCIMLHLSICRPAYHAYLV